MTVRRALATGALGLVLGACQGSAPPSAPPPAPKVDAGGKARAAMERQQWATAAPLLREAVAAKPSDVSLHYDLAIVATYLDLRDEAVREFRWVLASTSPESPEYKTSRSWLAEAGVLTSASAGSAVPASPAPARGPERAPVLHVERTGNAGLYGVVTWGAEPGGPPSTKRLQIHLWGLPDTPTKEQRYTVRTDDDGRYEFKRIVAGPYKVSDRIAGAPTWRLRVQVEPGRDSALDLFPGNSLAVRDDFPDSAR